jgi:hypothetical protein
MRTPKITRKLSFALPNAISKPSLQNPTSKSPAQKRPKATGQNPKTAPAALLNRIDLTPAINDLTNAVNREAWLTRAIETLRPEFAAQEHPLPAIVRASVGFTKSRKAVAECWHSSNSSDSVHEIFIKPTVDMAASMEVFKILAHELCHAALPAGTAHKRPFAALGARMLMEGSPKHMLGGEAFTTRWQDAVTRLGPIPAGQLIDPTNVSNASRTSAKKRKLKVSCTECAMTFRIAEKWYKEGFQCPDRDCTGLMEVD